VNYEHNGYLVLPRLRVQNYNMISSPLTWGAPAITGVVGFMHALQRIIPHKWDIDLLSVGLIMHQFEPQVNGAFDRRFNLTRNPPVVLRNHRKDISRTGEVKVAAIVEEGRAHATISLVFGIYCGENAGNQEKLQQRAREIFELAQGLRFVGGSFLPSYRTSPEPEILAFGGAENEADFMQLGSGSDQEWSLRSLKNSLLPGFALLCRDDLLREHTQRLKLKDPKLSNLDALLDLSRINYVYEQNDGDDAGEWVPSRKAGDGWLVPIPVGFTALSELYEPGMVKNARDPSVPFRFVESLYSLGEWRSPHRLELVQDLLWLPVTDHAQGLYRCIN